jgi:hypothetical protein
MNLEIEFKRTKKYLEYCIDTFVNNHDINFYEKKEITKNSYYKQGDNLLNEKAFYKDGVSIKKEFDNYIITKNNYCNVQSKKDFELNKRGDRIRAKFGWYWYGVFNKKRFSHEKNIWEFTYKKYIQCV